MIENGTPPSTGDGAKAKGDRQPQSHLEAVNGRRQGTEVKAEAMPDLTDEEARRMTDRVSECDIRTEINALLIKLFRHRYENVLDDELVCLLSVGIAKTIRAIECALKRRQREGGRQAR